jgi:hypothetical protein
MTTLERAMAGELLTPEELAELLKKPVKWIYEKRRPRCSNPIPALPLGRGSLRFEWPAILTWLDSCRRADAENLTKKRNAPRRARGRANPKVRRTSKQIEAQELKEFAQDFFKSVAVVDGVLESGPNDSGPQEK